MARTLTYNEQMTVTDVIRQCGESIAQEYGKHFSEEGVNQIFETGMANTQRIKIGLEDLGRRFFYRYLDSQGIRQFFVDETETKTVEVPQMDATDSVTPLVGYVEQRIMAQVEARLKSLKPQTETLEVVVNGQKNKVEGLTHAKFKTVLAYVANDEPVFLYGRAGTGKNVLCKQVAQALGLEFFFSNAVTQEHKLTGFIDAMGNYHETQFYKAFTQGGLFMLDEMDASIPEVLIILNAAIANRYFDFPTGRVEAHENFRVIAAGNTTGTGATYEYSGRNQLDAASLDRFAMIEIDYDTRVEKAVAGGDEELVRFVHDLRRCSEAVGRTVTVTYRGIQRMAKMSAVIGIEEALKTGIVKGMDKADLKAIAERMTKGGQYLEAFKTLA